MHSASAPEVMLDEAVLASNARAWTVHAQKPVWAVVKSDGYGWGLARVVRAVEREVAGFCVADVTEFHALRAVSKKPVILFAPPPPEELRDCIERGAIPTLTDPASVFLAAEHGMTRGRPCRVRIGIAPALGWFGVQRVELAAMIQAAQLPGLEIEAWTHLTAPEHFPTERAAFERFIAELRAAGIEPVAIDGESSTPLAHEPARYDRARIGIGLFGAYSHLVPGVACAITLTTRVLSAVISDDQTRVGYAGRLAGAGYRMRTTRLGYGDGFPRGMIGVRIAAGEIFSIGMQYMVLKSDPQLEGNETSIDVLHSGTHLTEFTAAGTVSMHELVLGLGYAKSRPAG